MPPTQPAGSWATVSAEVAKPPQQRLASGTSCRAHGGPHWQSRRSRPIATAAAALRVGLPHPPKRTGAHQDAGSLSSGTCAGAHRCECGAPGIPMLRRRQEALPLTHALAARCRGVAATCDAQQQDEAGQAALVAGLLPWQRARAHETQHGLCARVCAKQATREACPWPQDARRNCGWLGAGAERHAVTLRAVLEPPLRAVRGTAPRPRALAAPFSSRCSRIRPEAPGRPKGLGAKTPPSPWSRNWAEASGDTTPRIEAETDLAYTKFAPRSLGAASLPTFREFHDTICILFSMPVSDLHAISFILSHAFYLKII